MSAYLAVSSSSHGGIPAAVVVALIGAIVTTIVGSANFFLQRSAHKSQQGQMAKQINLTQSGQITDRFIRAIEQLGSSNSQVVIGAIFALERIASESPSDRPHIVTILANLVRSRLPSSAVGDDANIRVLQSRAPDAQVALSVLCRPPLSNARSDSSQIGGLDLSRTDLRRANLNSADLCRANLWNSDLRRAELNKADLRNSNLWNSRLEGADLHSSDLRESDLRHANFGSFDPSNPDYKDGTDLRGADLRGAQLQDAKNLSYALTEGTIWTD